MDLSWPRHSAPNIDGPTPISVNASIDKTLFPVTMVTLYDLLTLVENTDGQPFAAKLDWEVQY